MSTEVRSDFESYLQRYCEERDISKDEALKHKIVQYVKLSYEEAEADIIK